MQCRTVAGFPLASLYPEHGGDGSTGFVLTGIDERVTNRAGPYSGAGDVNGDGIDDLSSAPASPSPADVLRWRGYVVSGDTAGWELPAVFPLERLRRPRWRRRRGSCSWCRGAIADQGPVSGAET